MKPVIIYVDDEAHNLTVLEAALSSDWEIHIFDSPLAALDKIVSLKPWVVLSDQRMPGMTGVSFLEIVKGLCPHAIRALVTGYSDEDMIIDSVRKAQVFDYIRKPWDVDDLEHRVTKLVESFRLELQLREKNAQLQVQFEELKKLTEDIKRSQLAEAALHKELEAWAPPFILSAIKQNQLVFPLKKDLAVITFDIIGSSKLHGMSVNGKSVRAQILHAFSEITLKHNGWRESHSGDSAFAHFGLLKDIARPADAAFAVATEFRVFLNNFCNVHGIDVDCGVAMHIAKDCLVDVHTIRILTSEGEVIQKSFDSSSTDIDLVHRMEKFTHQFPGSNVAMSSEFVSALHSVPHGLIDMGFVPFKGQAKPVNLFLKKSDKVSLEEISLFVKKSNPTSLAS